MMVCSRYTIPSFYVYCVLIVCQLCNVRSQNNSTYSVFKFIRTDVKSPADIDQSCLTIDNSTLGTKYLGITLSILKATKNRTCRPQNIELKEIRKNIILYKQDRRVCKTEYTMSMNNKQCESTVRKYCIENNKKQIYFEECEELDPNIIYDKTENEDIEAISMSELPAPGITKEGPVYEIPRTRCNIKRFNSESLSTNQVTNYETTAPPIQKHPEEGYGVFTVLGSGLAGLISGVMITSLTCILIQKCKQSRNVNDVLSPESSLHLMVGRERKFSIHSKEEETVYHDISDIPGPSKGRVKCTLQSITNVQNNDEYLEQRYSESPKSSTSVNGNGSLSSLPSSKNIKFQRNEPSVSIQRGQVYHTLSKDDDIGSTKKEKQSASHSPSFPKMLDERASSKIGIIQTITSENDGLNPRETKNIRSTEPDNDSCLETPQNTTEALPGVYHVLQEKKEDQTDSESSDIITKITKNENQ